MKFALSSLITSVALLLPVLAHAQELGSKGDLIFSADRLMGISANKIDYDNEPGWGIDNDWTTISFLWKGDAAPNTLDLPRLGIDYVAIDHLTFGGSLAYASIDPDRGSTASAFLFQPRVGYLYSFNKTIGIWPRGGVTYHSYSNDSPLGQTYKALAFTAECPVTLSPTQHFAFHIGPTFDVDIFGSVKNPDGRSTDVAMRSFGLNAGLLGWF